MSQIWSLIDLLAIIFVCGGFLIGVFLISAVSCLVFLLICHSVVKSYEKKKLYRRRAPAFVLRDNKYRARLVKKISQQKNNNLLTVDECSYISDY